MTTSARLIVTHAALVAVVMAVSGYLMSLRQEEVIVSRMRDELHAHAETLQIALDNDYRDGRTAAAQQLIDRLSENEKLFGVLLFDEHGDLVMLSDPLVDDEIGVSPEVRIVIETGQPAETSRRIAGSHVYSVIMPIGLGGGNRGAFEIAQRVSTVEADVARARWEVAVTAMSLFATLCVGIVIITRRTVSRPIRELLAGAEALGRGDLDYRVGVPAKGGELERLGIAFNQMADRLEEQRRQRERELEERLALERELRHGERLALVGRLAAGVAHEIGAPLNVIGGRAQQLFAKPLAPADARRRHLTILKTQISRIARIVRQLLDLARPDVLRAEPVDLARVVPSALELVETDLRRARVAATVEGEASVVVIGDVGLLHQVLLNVILNAIQAMPGGGELRIALCVERSEAGEAAVVRIADNGPGFAPKDLPHVFDPFYTTKEVGQGTGLGLAISRRIVEEHGGRIEASTALVGGALVTIRLPLAEPALHSNPDAESNREVANDEGSIARS